VAASKQVLIGIDLGTTVLKAAAFDARTGRMLAQASRALKVAAAEDGTRQQDPKAVERALKSTLGKLRRELGRLGNRVRGLGLAAQGGSTIIADRTTGEPLTPVTLWNDSRAREERARVAAERPVAYWRGFSCRDVPGAGLARLLRLRRTTPELLDDENIYVGVGEYLLFKLTGLWRQDAGNALQIGCYNVHNQDLDQDPLDVVGVPVSFFAPMRRGHETHPLSEGAARALGLPGGIPVAGPYMDHEAGYLSALGVSDRPLQCSLGTAWVGNFRLPTTTTGGSPVQLVLPSPVDGSRLVVQPLLTGNVTWDWGLGTFIAGSHQRALTRLQGIFAEELLPPHGLMALPWNTQANPLEPSARGGGTFFGMNAHTTREHLIRALALSMTCEMLRVFEEVKASGEVDSVVLGGGASKGRFFQAYLAALFDPLPVFTLAEEDLAGTRGVLFAFSPKTSKARARRVRPVPERLRERILGAYELYLALFRRLLGDVTAAGAFHFDTTRGTIW